MRVLRGFCYTTGINPPDSVEAERDPGRKVRVLAFEGVSMTANVLIDGYNLYYGLLKGTPYKWLDLWAFARALLKEGIELQSVKYFTAQIKTHPHDQAAIDRQKIYLQALAAQGKVQVIHGFYNKNKIHAPIVDDRCGACEVAVNGLVPVYRLEEKRSDVNLAVSLVTDAATDAADCFLVVTGDSDQVGAIEVARHQFGKQVVIFNPHEAISKHLKWSATFYKNIPRDLPAKCQLPKAIPVGTHGNFIRRPPEWS